jgi:hypothetical protein
MEYEGCDDGIDQNHANGVFAARVPNRQHLYRCYWSQFIVYLHQSKIYESLQIRREIIVEREKNIT